MKNKLGCCLFLLIGGLAYLPFAFPPSSWQSSGYRVSRCFDLNFRISKKVSTSRISNAILTKFPIGTPQSDVELFLENKIHFFKQSSRNFIRHGKSSHYPGEHYIQCSFSGGGMFELVFREYSVFFIFDNTSNQLTKVDVKYGLTGF